MAAKSKRGDVVGLAEMGLRGLRALDMPERVEIDDTDDALDEALDVRLRCGRDVDPDTDGRRRTASPPRGETAGNIGGLVGTRCVARPPFAATVSTRNGGRMSDDTMFFSSSRVIVVFASLSDIGTAPGTCERLVLDSDNRCEL